MQRPIFQVPITLSEVFSNYQAEYKLHTEQIMYNLLKVTKEARDNQESNLKTVSDELQQADQCLKQMELEAASLPLNYKKDIMDTIKTYKKELQQIEKDFKKVEYDKETTQQEQDLYGERPSTSQINQALLKQEDRLVEQSLRLMQAKQNAYQTEEVAINVQRNLKNQSDTLSNSIRKTQTTRDDLGESNYLVNTMKNRIQQRRLVLYSTFSFICICAAYLVYSYLA